MSTTTKQSEQDQTYTMKCCDTERPCPVPPHPDVQLQINQSRLRDPSASLPFPRHPQPGMNDGTIFPAGPNARMLTHAALNRTALRGVLNVIVVLVDFPDKAMAPGAVQHARDLFFSGNTGSASHYFNETSRGNISAITGEVVGPFRLPRRMTEYANNQYGMGSAPNSSTMADDAFTVAASHIDFTKYDNDNDDYVDAFIVVHAGADGAVTGNPSDIWSVKWVLPRERTGNGGKKVYAFLTVPEDAQLGVCAHELGHLLFGWPDLYDLTPPGMGVGMWCLMGYGAWGGSPAGSVPTHPSAWCKKQQGWVTTVNETGNRTVTVTDVKADGQVYRLWNEGEPSPEYFLVENRRQTGYDASIPAPGLMVWHIDETVPDNSNEDRYQVALVQADGRRDLERDANAGDFGDVFPGASNNTYFNSSSNPNSNAYDGSETFVGITGIPPASAAMEVAFFTSPGPVEPRDIQI